jgi:hypothetical protein
MSAVRSSDRAGIPSSVRRLLALSGRRGNRSRPRASSLGAAVARARAPVALSRATRLVAPRMAAVARFRSAGAPSSAVPAPADAHAGT